MEQKELSQTCWNIFAFELKKTLNMYGMDLGHLDDRMGIHRETVRRLVRSLYTPKSLPVLNPEETRFVIDTLQLEQEHVLRLHAAILATAIQRMLSERIQQEDARLAAEQILPILLRALASQTTLRGLGNMRGGDSDPAEDSEIDMRLESALEAIDKGAEALHFSYRVDSYSEKVKKARLALSCFEEALIALNNLGSDIRRLPKWRDWYGQAQKEQTSAKDRLEELGE